MACLSVILLEYTLSLNTQRWSLSTKEQTLALIPGWKVERWSISTQAQTMAWKLEGWSASTHERHWRSCRCRCFVDVGLDVVTPVGDDTAGRDKGVPVGNFAGVYISLEHASLVGVESITDICVHVSIVVGISVKLEFGTLVILLTQERGMDADVVDGVDVALIEIGLLVGVDTGTKLVVGIDVRLDIGMLSGVNTERDFGVDVIMLVGVDTRTDVGVDIRALLALTLSWSLLSQKQTLAYMSVLLLYLVSG